MAVSGRWEGVLLQEQMEHCAVNWPDQVPAVLPAQSRDPLQ